MKMDMKANNFVLRVSSLSDSFDCFALIETVQDAYEDVLRSCIPVSVGFILELFYQRTLAEPGLGMATLSP